MGKWSLKQMAWRGAGARTGHRRVRPGQDRRIVALAVDVLVAIGERDAAETPRPDSHTASEFSNARRLGVLILHRDELGPAVDFSGVLKFGDFRRIPEGDPISTAWAEERLSIVVIQGPGVCVGEIALARTSQHQPADLQSRLAQAGKKPCWRSTAKSAAGIKEGAEGKAF